jgi:hypothetical protein
MDTKNNEWLQCAPRANVRSSYKPDRKQCVHCKEHLWATFFSFGMSTID